MDRAFRAQATIYLKTLIVNFTNTVRFSKKFQNKTNFYVAYVNYKNLTFKNYEFRSESHFGGRTVYNYMTGLFHLSFGGEA